MEGWPDHEIVLSRFRQWLDETGDELAHLAESEPGSSAESPGEMIGLYHVLEQLTAVRHEVKLLTKAARRTEEGHEAALLSMQAAIEQGREGGPQQAEAVDKVARPLVEALVDLDESLVRGRRAIESARRRVLEIASRDVDELCQQLDALYQTQPRWRRLLCRPWHEAVKGVYSRRNVETQRSIFDALIEGYALIEKRLHRAMQDQSILRMECVGRQVDPNSMTVLEVISDLTRPTGMVVEEVRPGYFWRDKVLRFAEVKAVGHA